VRAEEWHEGFMAEVEAMHSDTLAGGSWSHKIEGCEDFEEMRSHLVDYFRSIE
jgi:hypothetical protein